MTVRLAAVACLLAAGAVQADGIDILGADCRRIELPERRFAVTYHHSMYDRPVTEEFTVDGVALTLRRLESPSAAVLEYFGITAAGESHERNVRLDKIVMRVATGEAQTLRAGDRSYGLLDFGRPGDRIVIRAAAGPACKGRDND